MPGDLLRIAAGERIAVDARVERAGRVEPVEDPLREVVLEVLEGGAPIAERDQAEGGRGKPAARAGEVGETVVALLDAFTAYKGESEDRGYFSPTSENLSAIRAGNGARRAPLCSRIWIDGQPVVKLAATAAFVV